MEAIIVRKIKGRKKSVSLRGESEGSQRKREYVGCLLSPYGSRMLCRNMMCRNTSKNGSICCSEECEDALRQFCQTVLDTLNGVIALQDFPIYYRSLRKLGSRKKKNTLNAEVTNEIR